MSRTYTEIRRRRFIGPGRRVYAIFNSFKNCWHVFDSGDDSLLFEKERLELHTAAVYPKTTSFSRGPCFIGTLPFKEVIDKTGRNIKSLKPNQYAPNMVLDSDGKYFSYARRVLLDGPAMYADTTLNVR